jgi:flagellar protein FlaG
MEATQALKVQRLLTGFVDVKSMGYPASQNPEKSGISPVQSLDQIDLRTRDQIDSKNQDQQKQAKIAEQSMPAMLKDLESKINQMHEVGLEFSQYKDSGKIIVRVVEKGTNKVIREIPSEEFLDLVEKMDQMIGILFDKKV